MTPYRVFTMECGSMLKILEWWGFLCFQWKKNHQFYDSKMMCRGFGVCWRRYLLRMLSELQCRQVQACHLPSDTRKIRRVLRSSEISGLYSSSHYCLSECAVTAGLTNNKTHNAWKGFGISALESKRKGWKTGQLGLGGRPSCVLETSCSFLFSQTAVIF